jgi:putative ABC transport system substrate-binding protein
VRPGGNITGLTVMRTETNVKSLELLKETVSGLSRIAVIFDPATPSHGVGLKAVKVAAPALVLQIQPVAVRSATEFAGAFSAIVRERAGRFWFLIIPHSLPGQNGSRNSRWCTKCHRCLVRGLKWRPED